VTTDFVEDADGKWKWDNYTHAREIFVDALKNADFHRVELIANTAERKPCEKEIVMEQWEKIWHAPKKVTESKCQLVCAECESDVSLKWTRFIDNCDGTNRMVWWCWDCWGDDGEDNEGTEILERIDNTVRDEESEDAECEKKHPVDCPCADCELANPLCQDCRKRPKYDDGVCEKCYIRLGCDTESDEDEPDEDHFKCDKCSNVKEWGELQGNTLCYTRDDTDDCDELLCKDCAVCGKCGITENDCHMAGLEERKGVLLCMDCGGYDESDVEESDEESDEDE
jgi:hypothetical protein